MIIMKKIKCCVCCFFFLLICFAGYYIKVFSSKASTTYLNSSRATAPTNSEQKHIPHNQQQLPNSRKPFSKDLIVHRAFFDDRSRENHTNITVVFITVNKTILDEGSVVGCGVDGNNATNFIMYSGRENYLLHDWLGKNPFTYENMRVHCYDMPGKNGSEVHVTYKTGTSSEIIEVSQHPLYIPAPRVTPTGEYNFTAVTCSKIHNRNANFIREFVQYQKILGVDHVHFSILDHFIVDNGFHDFFENDALLWRWHQEGYLSFSVWKEWYADSKENGGEISLHSEILRKLGCMYQYIGTYDYVMPLDTDDFFVPRIPGKTKLKDYILKFCYSKPAGSCQFDWIWYYPECGLKGTITDGNVTAQLKTKTINTSHNKNYKSVHNTNVLYDSSFHDARCSNCLVPGYYVVPVPSHVAYVAHNRYEGKKDQPAPCHNSSPLI